MSRKRWIVAVPCTLLLQMNCLAENSEVPRRAVRPLVMNHQPADPTPTVALVDPVAIRLARLDQFYPSRYLDLDNLTLPRPEFMAQSEVAESNSVADGPFQPAPRAEPPAPNNDVPQPPVVPQPMPSVNLEPTPTHIAPAAEPAPCCPRCNRVHASCTQ